MPSTPPPRDPHPGNPAEQALVASEQRLASQSGALTSLMARYADSRDAFEDRVRGILAISARTLDVDRLSLWIFTEASWVELGWATASLAVGVAAVALNRLGTREGTRPPARLG